MPSNAFLVGSLLFPAGPGFAHGECEAFVVRILLCHLPGNGFHVLRGLLLCDAGLEPAEEGEPAVSRQSKSSQPVTCWALTTGIQ